MNRELAKKVARRYRKREVLFTREQIQRRVEKVCVKIYRAHKLDNDFVVVGVLNGAAIFTTDLMRELWNCGINPQLGYIGMSLFRKDNRRRESGPRITSPLSIDIEDKNVLVVEDIIDTGLTMKSLLEILFKMGAKTVEIVAVLVNYGFSEKDSGLPVKYVCFRKPTSHFVAGYGMDNDGEDRGFPHIYRVPIEGQPCLVQTS